MEKKNCYTRLLFVGLLCVVGFFACQPDDMIPNPTHDMDENHWIEVEMRKNYLWYNEIPSTSELHFNLGPEAFFNSLLSQKDGKHTNTTDYFYSWIEENKEYQTKTSIDPEATYGFEYQLFRIENNATSYYALVNYVLPNSPASEAGLSRGDWILKCNGATITQRNYSTLQKGNKVVFSVGAQNNLGAIVPTGTKELEVARAVDDNPLFLQKIVNQDGYKIGYLVYNHFTSGPNGDGDQTYENQLRTAFSQFKAAGVTEFVLDLRYNGGGVITSAQLLAALLVKASALNEVFCRLDYSDVSPYKSQITYFNKDNKGGDFLQKGENLNLSRLYVLVSNSSASASEAVINGLKPFMEVVLIGGRTIGKNVGSIHIANNKYKWALQPIVCYISNSRKESDYMDGFMPDISLSEFVPGLPYLELGNPNEIMLKVAIEQITGKSTPPTTYANTRSASSFESVYKSVNRKQTTGVRVFPIEK